MVYSDKKIVVIGISLVNDSKNCDSEIVNACQAASIYRPTTLSPTSLVLQQQGRINRSNRFRSQSIKRPI